MSWLNISQGIILDLLLQFVITKYSLGEIWQQLSPAISVHLSSDISAILIYVQRNLPFLSNMTESNITLSLKCHYVVKQNSEKLTPTTTGEIVEAHLLHIFSIIFPHFAHLMPLTLLHSHIFTLCLPRLRLKRRGERAVGSRN